MDISRVSVMANKRFSRNEEKPGTNGEIALEIFDDDSKRAANRMHNSLLLRSAMSYCYLNILTFPGRRSVRERQMLFTICHFCLLGRATDFGSNKLRLISCLSTAQLN